MTTVLVPLNQITHNPWQTRQCEPDPLYIKELALDIAANTMLQTPVGRLLDGSRVVYGLDEKQIKKLVADKEFIVQLAFGHNRLAAYAWLDDVGPNSNIEGDWSAMPVDIRMLNDEQMADNAWSENEKRRDITPIERAHAIQHRMDSFGWKQKEVATHLGISVPVVSNALRLLELPEELQQDMVEGKLSERAALALLPLFSLPESLRKKAEKNFWVKPSEIIKGARDGASSDEIRNAINKLIEHQCEALQGSAFRIDKKFELVGCIRSETCKDCDLRLKDRNACTDPDCFKLKDHLFKAGYLAKASQASGILPLENDGQDEDGYMSIYYLSQLTYKGEIGEAVAKSGCNNLRIYYDPQPGSNEQTLKDAGFPNAAILCSKKSGQCACLQGLDVLKARESAAKLSTETPVSTDGETDDEEEDEDLDTRDTRIENMRRLPAMDHAPTAEELQAVAKEAKQDKKRYTEIAQDLQGQAAKIIERALQENEPGAWRMVLDRLALGIRWDKRPIELGEIQTLISNLLVNERVKYEDPKQVPAKLNLFLREAGLPGLDGKLIPEL